MRKPRVPKNETDKRYLKSMVSYLTWKLNESEKQVEVLKQMIATLAQK